MFNVENFEILNTWKFSFEIVRIGKYSYLLFYYHFSLTGLITDLYWSDWRINITSRQFRLKNVEIVETS